MRHYITVFGGWWSVDEAGWRAIIEHALAHDGEYDFDRDARTLKGRPATVRIDENPRTGRTFYVDITGHRIHTPLDWNLEDWEDALRELNG